MDTSTRTVDKLFSVGERLSNGLRQSILALGANAESRLLEIIADDRLYESSARGGGWAPVHAFDLLGALRSVAAIPRLLEVVAAGDADDLAQAPSAIDHWCEIHL